MVEPAEAAPTAESRRFVSLDSARGLAACLVVIEHFNSNGILTGSKFAENGWLAVNFFFVLSGFVICGNYASRLAEGFSYPRYLFLRLGRIWPVHAFVLAILVALELLKLSAGQLDLQSWRAPFSGTHSPGNLVLAVFLLNGWQAPFSNLWSPQSWSISTELFLYVSFGAVWALRRNWSTALAAVVFCAIAAMDLAGWAAAWSYIGQGLLGFSAGVVIWAVHARWAGSDLPGGGRGASLLEIGAAIACCGVVAAFDRLGMEAAVVVFALAILIFARDAGALSRLLAKPLPRRLGRISLSIYLVHPVVSGRLYDAFGALGAALGFQLVASDGDLRTLVAGPLASDVIAALSLIVVIIVAGLAYRWVESPARSASRRIAGVPTHSASPAKPERWW